MAEGGRGVLKVPNPISFLPWERRRRTGGGREGGEGARVRKTSWHEVRREGKGSGEKKKVPSSSSPLFPGLPTRQTAQPGSNEHESVSQSRPTDSVLPTPSKSPPQPPTPRRGVEEGPSCPQPQKSDSKERQIGGESCLGVPFRLKPFD